MLKKHLNICGTYDLNTVSIKHFNQSRCSAQKLNYKLINLQTHSKKINSRTSNYRIHYSAEALSEGRSPINTLWGCSSNREWHQVSHLDFCFDLVSNILPANFLDPHWSHSLIMQLEEALCCTCPAAAPHTDLNTPRLCLVPPGATASLCSD